MLAILGLGLFAVKVGSARDTQTAKNPAAQVTRSLDAGPLANDQLAFIIEMAVDAGASKHEGVGATTPLVPLLGLVGALSDAGLLSKPIAGALRDALIKNAVEGGKEILVDVAKKQIEGWVPPAPMAAKGPCCCCGCALNFPPQPQPPKGTARSRCPVADKP